MAWSYSGDPRTSLLDEVRFHVGDTDETDVLVQDGEILYVIQSHTTGTGPTAVQPSAFLVAAEIADDIAAKFARQITKGVGRLRITAEKKAEHYRELANDLRKKAPANWYSGGLSVADKQRQTLDQDAVQPKFHKGMMAGYPGPPPPLVPGR